MQFKDISVQDFKNNFQDSELIIDIRDRDSHIQSNIPNSKNYDSEDIMELTKKNKKDAKIVIYCYHGNSSRKVASFLSEYGFKNVYSLIGGFDAWKSNL
tara:strand:- start:2260 stop:2556 length:297 start_codon:yes stop_codon:yes gene_type:complete